ncbi:hypothetical protein EMIT0P176_160101 [Pseudomonas sp. IT-P176]
MVVEKVSHGWFHNRDVEMFGEHFSLQNFLKFSIGQSPSALALYSCSRNKSTDGGCLVFLVPYRLTMLVVTGAVCRYHV